MAENETLTLTTLFQDKTRTFTEKTDSLLSLAPDCQMLRVLQNQHFTSLEKCREAEYRRIKMINAYNLNLATGRHIRITTLEFKDFLIHSKSMLDSMARELNIIFNIQKPRPTFNLKSFINAIEKIDGQFANDLKKYCKNDNWFEYFVNLRNAPTHTGGIELGSYVNVVVKPGINSVVGVYRKIEGEIEDISDKESSKTPGIITNMDIKDSGYLLPDNPEETDTKKPTYKLQIKFKDYPVGLLKRFDGLFKICYQEIDNQLEKMEISLSNKKCRISGCNQKNCRFRRSIKN